MSLRPFKSDVYFFYKCPQCAQEHQQSYAEVNKIGKLICYCGELLEFAHMNGVKVVPNYNQTLPAKPVVNPVTPKPAGLTEEQDEIVKGLTKLGFRKSEARIAVDKVLSRGIIEGESENEFFNRCFKEARK